MRARRGPTLVLLAAGLLGVAASRADDPLPGVTLPAKVEAEAGGFVVLKATTAGKRVKFLPLDPLLKQLDPGLLKDGKTGVFVAPVGTYRVLAYSAVDGDPTEPAVCLVVVGSGVNPGPGPSPVPPVPVPPPDPLPGPVKLPYHLLVIEETNDAGAGRGAILADVALRQRLVDKGHKMRFVDKDVRDSTGQVPTDLKPYLARAAGKALPLLFVVDSAGKVLSEAQRPADAAGFLTLLTKLGG